MNKKIKKIILDLLYYSFFKYYYSNVITFESIPNLEDNTYYVYKKMLELNINNTYKFVWLFYEDNEEKNKIKNVKYVHTNKRYTSAFYVLFSHYHICCNEFIYSRYKEQKSIYLNHGTPIKNIRNYFKFPQNFDFQLSPSKNFTDLLSFQSKFPKQKIVELGYPKIDALVFSDKIKLEKLFGKYDKYIIWYPTVRQFKCGLVAGNGNDISIFKNKDDYNKLNNYLVKNNTLIIIKHHFAEKSTFTSESYSNIKFIDDNFYKEHKFKAYEFIKEFDALITDYSSIYYDFLILDRPICMVWNDIEDYKKNPGLVENYEEICSGSFKAYNLDDLIYFINNVKLNNDELKEKRNKIKDYFYEGINVGKITDEVTNFIIEEFKLKI